MNIRRFLHLAAILIFSSSSGTAGAETREDFSGGSGLWRFGARGGGNGKHTIHNGRLEFSTQGRFTKNDSATHYWKAPVGTYDTSWEVQADVSLGSFQLGNNNPYAGLALLVANQQSL